MYRLMQWYNRHHLAVGGINTRFFLKNRIPRVYSTYTEQSCVSRKLALTYQTESKLLKHVLQNQMKLLDRENGVFIAFECFLGLFLVNVFLH